MATSRPIRQGDRLTRLYNRRLPEGEVFNGGSRIAQGDENRDQFVLQSDFGLTDMINELYRGNVCARVFGISDCTSLRDPRLAAAITNGTAPGLYVREGDDTSDWETYRQVLARRVEEAMAARRRGGAGGGETATAAPSRQDDEIRVGDVVEVVSCTGSQTWQADIGRGGRVSHIAFGIVYVNSVDGMRLPVDNTASLADVRKVSPSSPPITVALSVSPMTEQEAARIATTVTDEVRRGVSRRLADPVPPAVSVSLRPPATAASPPPPTIPPPPPSRFSLLEVDLPPGPPSSTRRSLDADLAALQDELRAERERNRALAAAQAQKSRFDLLECDLPAVPVAAAPVAAVAVKASPRPVVSSPPKSRNPIETITDLTTARSPLELARILEGLNDELSTMMRQREAN